MGVENLTSASNTGQESISELVQVKLRKNAVLAGLFSDMSRFAMPGDKSVSFPRWSNEFQVQKLSGSQKGDDQEALFALDKIELTEEAHIQWAIKKFDQQKAKVDILQQAISEATVQHAIGLDEDIYTELSNLANIDDNNELSGALTQDKVVDMIVQANTIRMPKQNRAFVFSNDEYGALLKIDGFVDASKSGLEIVRSGQIGTLYGIPVFESDVVSSGESYLVHRDAIFYAFGALPSIEDQKAIEYGTGSRRWVVDQLYGLKSTQSGKLVVRLA